VKIVNKAIDVLCWFDYLGSPNPVRFRLKDEAGAYAIVKIHKILTKEHEKLAGNKMIVFTCQCTIQNTEKIIVIKYEMDSCKWILFKL
jgi:hypothetical protein